MTTDIQWCDNLWIQPLHGDPNFLWCNRPHGNQKACANGSDSYTATWRLSVKPACLWSLLSLTHALCFHKYLSLHHISLSLSVSLSVCLSLSLSLGQTSLQPSKSLEAVRMSTNNNNTDRRTASQTDRYRHRDRPHQIPCSWAVPLIDQVQAQALDLHIHQLHCHSLNTSIHTLFSPWNIVTYHSTLQYIHSSARETSSPITQHFNTYTLQPVIYRRVKHSRTLIQK